jgi:hypothetical protein
MTDEVTIQQPSVQQTAAAAATEAAIDAVVTNAPPEKTEAAFNRSSIEHRRSAAATEQIEPGDWRDGNEVAPLPQMPDAPTLAAREVTTAIDKLNELGGEHSRLLDEWGSGFGENLAYAKQAFKEIVADNPGIIAKVDRSGLGNDPAVLRLLANHGRMKAGMTGDFETPVQRTGSRLGDTSERGQGRGGSAQAELDQLMTDNPPGTAAYKSPRVQRRVEALSRQISGGGNVIGRGGRVV